MLSTVTVLVAAQASTVRVDLEFNTVMVAGTPMVEVNAHYVDR